MLVLSRYKNESIVINDDIVVTIVEIRGNKVRLGVEAPAEVPVHRREIYDKRLQENTRTLAPVEERIERDAEKARTFPYPRIASPPSVYAPETD